MKIWIDLANSPHVPFFVPVRERLLARGHEVVLTARDFSQTLPLARMHGLPVTPIGGHGGARVLEKGRSIARRTLGLRRWAASARPDLAVGHNSYAQSLAARMLGIASATIMDYEHTPANHVSFRLADLVIVPELLDPGAIARYGARRRKLFRYRGIKEMVYLSGFSPDPHFERTEAGRRIDASKVLVLARPPADFALYHRFENPLFEPLARRLAADPRVQLFLMPRTAAQRSRLEALGLGLRGLPGLHDDSWFVPEETSGADLIARADLVVSAGGTMNREAAVLGTPAVSVFTGEMGAVDWWLAASGRLIVASEARDLEALPLVKKTAGRAISAPALLDEIVDALESLGGSH